MTEKSGLEDVMAYSMESGTDPFDPDFDRYVGAHLRRVSSMPYDLDKINKVVKWLASTSKECFVYQDVMGVLGDGDFAELCVHPSFIRAAGREGFVCYIDADGFVRKWQLGTDFAVTAEEDIFLEPEWYCDLKNFVERGESVLLIGPSGCGKTEAVERVFRARRQKLRVVDCAPSMCADDLEGHTVVVPTPQGPTTDFVLAAPALACREGHGILFNEADALPAEAAYSLYSLLNRKPMSILRTGEEVPVHPRLRIVGTQNTEGRGDVHGLFHGRSMQDESFLDRWDQFIVADYLPLSDESRLLESQYRIGTPECDKIVLIAEALRRPEAPGGPPPLLMSVGMRRTKKVAANIAAGYAPLDAWTFAVTNRATAEDKVRINEVLQRFYGSKK